MNAIHTLSAVFLTSLDPAPDKAAERVSGVSHAVTVMVKEVADGGGVVFFACMVEVCALCSKNNLKPRWHVSCPRGTETAQ